MPVPDPARNKKMPTISNNVFSLHKIYLSSAFSLYSLKYSIYIIRFPSYDYLKLFLFSLPCSQLILSKHMHRFWNHQHADHRNYISQQYNRNIECKAQDNCQPHPTKRAIVIFFCTFIE